MIRSRRSATGAVIEKGEVREVMRQIEHVHITVSYGLRFVSGGSYDKMRREDGIGIDQYLIFSAFPALERHKALLGRTVLHAQKAWARLHRGLVGLGESGAASGRIVLHRDRKTAHFSLAELHILQSPEVCRRKRPLRELVPDELMDERVLFHFSDTFLLRAISSQVLSLSL